MRKQSSYRCCVQAAFNALSSVKDKCQASTIVAKGAACGSGAGPQDVCWVLSVTTVNPDMDTSSCEDYKTKPRCSQVGVVNTFKIHISPAGLLSLFLSHGPLHDAYEMRTDSVEVRASCHALRASKQRCALQCVSTCRSPTVRQCSRTMQGLAPSHCVHLLQANVRAP